MSLNRILEGIQPTLAQTLSVIAAKNRLQNIIQNKADQGLLPVPLDFITIGSFDRGTKIIPLDDVDILYIVGKGYQQYGQQHSLSECSYNFSGNQVDYVGNIISSRVLDLIKNQLIVSYPRSELHRNGEAVNVYLSTYNVGFDIVPAVEIQNAYSRYMLIPSGSNQPGWKLTNPLVEKGLADKLNELHRYQFKNIVKLVKYWFKQKQIQSPRSYHTEALMYSMFNKLPTISDLQEGLLLFYNLLPYYQHLLASCPDPAGLSAPLSSGLTNDDINRIIAEASRASFHLLEGELQYELYVG